MGKPQKISLADQVMINAAARIAVDRISDIAQIADDIATLREVLDFTTREMPMIGRLAGACDDLEAAVGVRMDVATPEWARAKFFVSEALCPIFRWRHALALDAYRASLEKAA